MCSFFPIYISFPISNFTCIFLSVSEDCKARNGLGNCSTICLPTATGRTCACNPGHQLKQDGRTCSNSKV